MSDVNNFDSRRKKVQEFEVTIDEAGDEKAAMEIGRAHV